MTNWYVENVEEFSDLKDYLEWVESIEVGDRIVLRWTNCGSSYSAEAEITKVNGKSLIGKILHEVKAGMGVYPIGNAIKVPRPAWGVDWSWNNCPMKIKE
jgi:hypothetical protein